jgi:tRNA dimethylallyltransferase
VGARRREGLVTSESGIRGSAAGHGPGLVIGVLGPTGVGKTAVALELAALLGTSVISCDSMQLYRGFPVLTNQPSAEVKRMIPCELVGCVEPGRTFSAAEYAALARPFMEEALTSRGWALLVGGTGLYMRATLAPLAVAAAADPALRARLEAHAADEGPGALHAELARLDPTAAQSIDQRNVRRVIRALESVSATGRAWSGREDLWAPAYRHPTMVVGLVVEREELYRRIDARAARMVEGAAVEEVRRFRQEWGAERSKPGGAGICSAIGYREICRYLEGEQTLAETAEQVAAATRRYARRQLTWLRKVGDAVIIDVQGRDPCEIAHEIADRASRKDCTKEPHHP